MINGIPKTNIVFNTWYSASFFMEPRAADMSTVPLDKEHRMVLEYLQNGKSWDKTEYRRMQGKRAADKVLEVHMNHCLKSLPKQEADADEIENAHA